MHDLTTAHGFDAAFKEGDIKATVAQTLFEVQFPESTRRLSGENRNVRCMFIDRAANFITRINAYKIDLNMGKGAAKIAAAKAATKTKRAAKDK